MTEGDLAARVRSGDAVAFRELVEMFQDRVFNTAMGLLHNREDAEDTAQEVFVSVYHAIGGFRGQSKLSTWLYRITVTKCLDLLRKRKRKKRFGFLVRLFSGEKDDRGYEPSDPMHPGTDFENKERAAVLFRAVDSLPENQKTAFTLCQVEGLSQKEAAEVMNVTAAAVESLIHRAKQNLRDRLRAHYTPQDSSGKGRQIEHGKPG